jgi:hypothetical protein
MLVYLHSNYGFPDLFRQTPKYSGEWGNFQFTLDPVDKCDYVVVLNRPTEDIHIKCRKGGRILIIQEPPYEQNSYFKEYFKYFDLVISDFKDDKFNILHNQAGLPWHINLNYDQLKGMTKDVIPKKHDKVSWVTSNVNVNPGHLPRLELLRFFQEKNYAIDLFGRGINPIDDKLTGILPYKYNLAIENYAAPNYWTEKIADAFLSWTMPIYYGCTNIEKFFPENSFIKIDILKPQEAIEVIQNAIENNLWEKNINAIEESRNLILEKYQLFPTISKLILDNLQQSDKFVNYSIPLNPVTKFDKLMDKIKRFTKKD